MTERERIEEHDAACDHDEWLIARDAPETRRTPMFTRLMRTPAEAWDDELGRI